VGSHRFIRAPKNVHVSDEVYPPNMNYGHAKILKEYSGYPMDKPVRALIPHGIAFDDELYTGEITSRTKVVLNNLEFRDAPWSDHKVVIPSAFTFMYAKELYGDPNLVRRGTVYFPQHSTSAFHMDVDWWDIYDKLKALPEEFKPITICLYWEDVNRGTLDKYWGGFKTVCNGHVYDQDFYKKLVPMLQGAKYIASNDIGSYTFHATMVGTPFFLLGKEPYFRVKDDPHLRELGFRDTGERSDMHKEHKAYAMALFKDIVNEPTKEQIKLAEYYERASAFKSPEELRKDLEYCEELGPYGN
jgi:hypothetical protein